MNRIAVFLAEIDDMIYRVCFGASYVLLVVKAFAVVKSKWGLLCGAGARIMEIVWQAFSVIITGFILGMVLTTLVGGLFKLLKRGKHE